jgi:predicted TIM-barrel fold metal-dependent hydrolase
MWAEYADPGDRDLALTLDDDDLGHTWLRHGGRTLHLAEVHHPADTAAMAEYRRRVRESRPPEASYDEKLPREHWDPVARREQLTAWGLDRSVVFPNFGLLWERMLEHDVRAQTANMRAWNRWAAVVAAEAQGRLLPVAHVTLRDVDWLEVELARLASDGLRLAMVAPALVDGKRLSHPDVDRAWRAFVDHGITPVFHVSAFPHPFADGWYEGDPDVVNPVLSSVFLSTAPALALADLAVNGTFARHPELRIGVMELSAIWVPQFLLVLDGGFDFHARFNGAPLTRLDRRPSEYVRDHTRIAAFGYERPDVLTRKAGDLFMFCSDWPHAEGSVRPLDDYTAACGLAPGTGESAELLFGGNLAWLLRER